jgi:hypothetical protein
MRYLFLFLLLFANCYNPFSVYLTLAINILYVLYLLLNNKRILLNNRNIVFLSFIILIWSLIIMTIQTNVNTYISGKYIRNAVTTLLLMIIINGYKIPSYKLINTLSVVLLLHVLFVGLQILFPILDKPMSEVFGFERGFEVISRYNFRKLGLTGGYDTAAFFSIISVVFFLIRYLFVHKILNLLYAFLSLLSCIFISRTGMIIGIVYFIVFIVYIFFRFKRKKKILPAIFLLSGLYVLLNFVIPILSQSTNLLSDIFGVQTSNINALDYTAGTVDALTGSHLSPLNIPFFDMLFGFGVDPNSIKGISSDIGYVKIIYHVGIIGFVFILLLYFKIFQNSYFIRKSSTDSNEKILSLFVMVFISIVLVINYKNLIFYSRGSYELLLIVYFVIYNNSKSLKTQQ